MFLVTGMSGRVVSNKEVTIPDDGVRREITALLRYGKAGRGRSLKQAYGPLALKRGCCLEPSPQHPNVADFNEREYRSLALSKTGGKHGRELHCSPFLGMPGVTLETWCVDILHTRHFGPMSKYFTFTLQQLLTTPVWKPGTEGLEKEDEQKLSLYALRAEMWAFYKRKRADPEWQKRGTEARGSETNRPQQQLLKP